MRLALLSAPVVLMITTPAAAQMHDMGGMPMRGMAMPAKKAASTKPPAKAKSTVVRKAPTTFRKPAVMPGMDMAAPAPMDAPGAVSSPPAGACPPEHAAMGHCTPATSGPATAKAPPAGTDQPAGNAPPPAPPTTLAAASFYDPAAMAKANRVMRDEHGGMRFSQILFNLAEVDIRDGRDGYRWDGEGWFGGDIDRAVIKSEGEGTFGDRLGSAEVQALYARAVGPYWNLQAGIRQDIGAGARAGAGAGRTYAVIGVEGLAPYWFEVEGAVFLSDKGDILARAEAWYDQRITQRAVLQPRVEFNLAAQDVPGSRIGAGLSDAEIGLRLRYEVAREFAPYVGIAWERAYGATARYARRNGDDTGGLALAIGIRGWF